MRRRIVLVLGSCLASMACSPEPAPRAPVKAPTAATAAAPMAAPAPAASSAAPPSAAAPPPGVAATCGNEPCGFYPSATDAFAALLDPAPAVLGIGEAHAQKGSEAIEPPTRRFTRDLLPLLAGRASDIVIELLLPNPACAPAAKEAKEKQKVVTEHQAKTDQNDYVALGTAAKALGIRPHALEPTCDDLSRIAKAGPDVVTVSLDVVTRLAKETISRFVATNDVAKNGRMVVVYGGAMHNDVAPPPERAGWSFGPAMQELTRGRYTEVDLIVPESISDSPAWRSLPWVPGFDRDAHPRDAVVLSPAPRGYVLVFPRTLEVTSPGPSASPAPPP
jgi:hypothetical protein